MRRGPVLAAIALLLVLASCRGGTDTYTTERTARPADAEETDPTGLVADFEFSVKLDTTRPTFCPSVAVDFTDTSTGGPTTWHWTFPDGSASDEQHPTYEHGVHTPEEVTLTVGRGSETDSVTKTVRNDIVC